MSSSSGGTKIRCSGCNAKLRLPEGTDPSALRCPRCGTRVGGAQAGAPGKEKSQPEIPAKIGDYDIVRFIAKGGMGMVYEARKAGDDRAYAVKVMTKEAASREEWVARFYREARIAMRIEHPHAVQTTACADHDGAPYMAMELVDGTDLSALIKSQGAMPWQTAVAYTLQVARCLEAMCEAGIVHRDIKPQNIMLTANKQAKLADFGLAKILEESDDDPASASLTMTGTQMGSPAYMPPEQIEDALRVTPAADVYSLGASLYELATGRRPFPGKSAVDVMQKVLKEEPQRPRELVPDIPPALDELIIWCLAKDAQARPKDGRHLVALLEHVVANPQDVDGLYAKTKYSSANGDGSGGGGKVITIIVLVAILAVAAGAAWYFGLIPNS